MRRTCGNNASIWSCSLSNMTICRFSSGASNAYSNTTSCAHIIGGSSIAICGIVVGTSSWYCRLALVQRIVVLSGSMYAFAMKGISEPGHVLIIHLWNTRNQKKLKK